MVREVSDYYFLYKIAKLIDTGIFKDIGYTVDDFFRYLIERFDEDRIKVFICVDGKKIKGFVVCSLAEDVVRKTPQVFVDLAYVEPKAQGVSEELMRSIEDYARELNVKEICAYSLRGERGMFRKFGFKLDYKVFVKKLEVKNEK